MTSFERPVEVRRYRGRLGRLLRQRLCCPVCRSEVRIVSHRERTSRFQCTACGLRFSVSPGAIGTALRDHPEAVVARYSETTTQRVAYYADPKGDPTDAHNRALTALRLQGIEILTELKESS